MIVITTLLVLLLFSPLYNGSLYKRKLTDFISHHDTLKYDTSVVQQQHERITRRSSSSVAHNLRWNPLKIRFTALNREFNLVMFPNRDIISPEADFVVYSADSPRRANFDPSVLYKGTLESKKNTIVHGYIVNGVFDGVIMTPHEEYHVEVAEKFFDQPVDFHSVIYATSHVDFMTVNGSRPLCGETCTDTAFKNLREIQSTARPVIQERNTKLRTKRALSPDQRFCPILIAADDLFFQNVGGASESTTMNELTSLVISVNNIFSSTDFDQDGSIDSIGFLIKRIEIRLASSPGYQYGAPNIAVIDFLDLWSQENHDEFCLAILLTYRDFDGGVMGLAWNAEPPGGIRGGICEPRLTLSMGQRNLNSAVMTFLNFGERQPRPVTIITMAHQFGHNFGSLDDPIPSVECSPGGSQGNYLMYPGASDGNLPNNNVFSSCSRRSMLAVLTSKSGCFVRSREICGNGVVEGDEDCDCGHADSTMCNAQDPCCTINCTLKVTSQCTPLNPYTPCCSQNCQIIPANSMECSEATECARPVMCNGISAVCPDPITNDKGTLCNKDRYTCLDGVCAGSVCLRINTTECEYNKDQDMLCTVSCTIYTTDGTERCVSTSNLVNINETYKEPGRACNNFTGYCDSDGTCVGVNNDDLVNKLRNRDSRSHPQNSPMLSLVLLMLGGSLFLTVGHGRIIQ